MAYERNEKMAAQLPDIVLLNGKARDLYSNPLESFWEKTGRKRPDFKTQQNCKRGYVASWSIERGNLVLTDITGIYYRIGLFGRRESQITVGRLFPKSKSHAILANWFSGKLRIPDGNMTMYEHVGYNSRFEKEIIITIEKGVAIKTVKLDYTKQTLVVNPITM
ncbi:MAG TPA: hypothetical protein P5280_11725 [Cyclobacteriaceae bacterium]|nr:hypothetical protein [Cyclobacteriaceae bacterium]